MGTSASGRIVVVGASAGGVDALPRLLAQLPQTLDAAVVVVQHIHPRASEHLIELLQRRCALPVQWADDEQPIEMGHVYVARPDVHVIVGARELLLVDGPKESHARPSISRLFRSAAAHHGSRVVGVLLTGSLDDGAAGLVAIRRCGGAIIVQDPRDAAVPEMPQHALEAVIPDAILPLSQIGGAIEHLVQLPAPNVHVPQDVATEAELDRSGRIDSVATGGLGPRAPISCPDCGGPLWQVGAQEPCSYRCFLGHAMSTHTLLADKASEIERSLWGAVRALEERSTLLAQLAQDDPSTERAVGPDYLARSREAHAQAERARELLLDLRSGRESAAARVAARRAQGDSAASSDPRDEGAEAELDE